MRRSRTPTTAWPAVADLMTILAVVGLTAAAVVAGIGSSPDPDGPGTSPERKDDTIRALRDSISKLLLRQQVGFIPCWPDTTGSKLYFTTYDLTHQDGRYSLSLHADFETGVSAAQLSPQAERVVREIPDGTVPGPGLAAFGTRVNDAIRDDYDAGCELAVTINRDVTGREVAVIREAGFYPVFR